MALAIRLAYDCYLTTILGPFMSRNIVADPLAPFRLDQCGEQSLHLGVG
jgi:hypothetical protein